MQAWMAHTERENEPVTGSTRRVEAENWEDAATRAAEPYWSERPSLFDKVDDAASEVIVVVQATTAAQRLDLHQPVSRWRCTVTCAPEADIPSVHVERVA